MTDRLTGPGSTASRTLWVTTSWDDGYPLDTRLAELLDRYGIAGTFYVPVRSQLPVMNPGQIRQLSGRFEIGGHTLNHVQLDTLPAGVARDEILSCKGWLEDLTGARCTMFCPPSGRFYRSHLRYMKEAGYIGVRTVELMSVSCPTAQDGLMLLPTSLQVYPHGASTYLKNAVKRRRWENLRNYFTLAHGSQLVQAADSILEKLLASGGMLHIWGHSWELEHSRLWGALTDILKLLHAHRDRCRFVSNSTLCEQFMPVQSPTREHPELCGSLGGHTQGRTLTAARIQY